MMQTETVVRMYPTQDTRVYSKESKLLFEMKPGIRIAMISDSVKCYLSPDKEFVFARKCDCEMAIAALEREGLNTVESIRRSNWEAVKKICCEAMQW